jgi:hypothetical protein
MTRTTVAEPGSPPRVGTQVLHRRTRIEETSGLRESAIHSLMMAEVASR